MTPEDEALFFRKFRKSLPDGEHPDEEESDSLVLFVMDEFPVETLNNFLREDAKHLHGNSKVRLADKYNNLPDFIGLKITKGTKTPLSPAWRSPFVGKTLADAVAWIRGIPKPPKAANKVYFAVIQKELYEADGDVLMCKVVEGESEPQTIPCSADMLTIFIGTYHSDQWEDACDSQCLLQVFEVSFKSFTIK